MEKKLTKVDKFNMIMEIEEVKANEVLMEFCMREIELLKKKSDSKRPTKDQEENKRLKRVIIDTMRKLGRPARAEEIRTSNDELVTYSGQKITALLTQLSNENSISRVTDKKKTFFSLLIED